MKKNIIDYVRKSAGALIHQQKLIEQNDQIVIGLSGGKDSLVLLDILDHRKRILPFDFDFKVVHVNVENIMPSVDEEVLKKFCDSYRVSLDVIKIAPDISTGADMCFICSWYRRKAMFEYCREQGANKLALGHNLDDVASTVLMNMTMQGNISTMPYSIDLFDGNLKIIRPLASTEERDIAEYAKMKQLPIQGKQCPHSKNQSRDIVKRFFGELETITPQVKRNIMRSLENIREDYLP